MPFLTELDSFSRSRPGTDLAGLLLLRPCGTFHTASQRPDTLTSCVFLHSIFQDHKSFYFPLRASALSFNRIFETENENEREHSKGRKRDDLTAGQR